MDTASGQWSRARVPAKMPGLSGVVALSLFCNPSFVQSGQPVRAVEISPSLLAPGPLLALPGDAMDLGPYRAFPMGALGQWDPWTLPWASWDRRCSVVFDNYYYRHSDHDGDVMTSSSLPP